MAKVWEEFKEFKEFEEGGAASFAARSRSQL